MDPWLCAASEPPIIDSILNAFEKAVRDGVDVKGLVIEEATN